jgi:hypothetical protein
VRLNSSVRTTEHLVAQVVVWILTTPIPKEFEAWAGSVCHSAWSEDHTDMPEAGVRPSRIRFVAAMARMPSLKAPSRTTAKRCGVLRRHLRNRFGG